GPSRLLLALRRDQLQRHTTAPGPHQGPGALPVARGHPGPALLAGGRRIDAAHAGTGRSARLSPVRQWRRYHDVFPWWALTRLEHSGWHCLAHDRYRRRMPGPWSRGTLAEKGSCL